MCGIVGVLAFDRSAAVSREQLARMTDTLAHRGPDGQGHYISEEGQLGLGHRRLSILDLSEQGAQPMKLYNTDRYVLTFNGEIYNYVEIREVLKRQGYSFHTQTDTEVLLRLYAIKGEACLEDIDGMFAFAIWDTQKKTLFCARDRFGEKPFYYTANKGEFAFASEMKALFALGQSVNVNEQRVFDYLHYGFVVDRFDTNTSFYRDIFELEPSHYMLISENGDFIKKRYWNIDLSQNSNLSLDQATEQFTALFDESVKTRLRSDVPVGSSLSGGLDSSSIVATIDKIKTDQQKQMTFSARFKNHPKDEGEYIKALSEHVGVSGHMVWPDADSFVGNIQKHFYFQEEPYQHSSVFAQHEVMRIANENDVTVLLDGQGADEILGGYHGFFWTFLKELWLTDPANYHRQKHLLQEQYAKSFEFSFTKRWSYRYPGLTKILGSLRKKKNNHASNDHLTQAFFNDHYRSYKPMVPERLRETLFTSCTTSSLPKLLRYGDRNSMAHSREVRLPFLYHKLVEFLFTLPPDLLINAGWTKYILRESMKERLPDKITWRKDKVGYEPPQAQWMKRPVMQELIREAETFLTDQKIIAQPTEKDQWKHLMIYQLYNSFK